MVSHFWTLRIPFFSQCLPFLYTFSFLQVIDALWYVGVFCRGDRTYVCEWAGESEGGED